MAGMRSALRNRRPFGLVAALDDSPYDCQHSFPECARRTKGPIEVAVSLCLVLGDLSL